MGYPSLVTAATFLGHNHKPRFHILLGYQKGSFLAFLFLYCRSFISGCHPAGGESNLAAIGLMFKSSVEVHPHGPMIGLQFYKYRLWMAWRNFFLDFLPNWKLVT
jgi:hypothetical protein